jgi:hypothetical protein
MAAAVATAALVGAIAGTSPAAAVAVVGGVVVLALPFVAPVTHLVLLLAATAIVPYEVQNAVAFGGGQGSPGLLPSDVLLIGGLARMALVLPDLSLTRMQRLALGLVVLVLAVVALQFVHGVLSGGDIAAAGAEFRTLLGLSVALIALPILLEPDSRARLLAGLMVVALVLGLWGLVQWGLGISLTAGTDAGVREGVSGTTAGRGQLQGGLFSYPIAIVLAFAVLVAGDVRGWGVRVLLLAVIAVNAAGLLLTYERTFWAATLVGLLFVGMRAPRRVRAKALVAVPALALALIAAAAAIAPAEVRTAAERLASVRGGGSEATLRYRLVESRYVVDRIEDAPLSGSGLGATIRWGRPYDDVPPSTETYSHNGYLWLAWKLGIPAAAVLIGLLALLISSPRRPSAVSRVTALVTGAQASLLGVLLVSVTFPPFNALTLTATLGMLIAMAVLPQPPGRPHPDRGP